MTVLAKLPSETIPNSVVHPFLYSVHMCQCDINVCTPTIIPHPSPLLKCLDWQDPGSRIFTHLADIIRDGDHPHPVSLEGVAGKEKKTADFAFPQLQEKLEKLNFLPDISSSWEKKWHFETLWGSRMEEGPMKL